jgi:hypothetical protein
LRATCCLLALGLSLSCKTEPIATTDGGCVGLKCLLGGEGGTVTGGGGGAGGGVQRNEQIYELNPVRDLDLVFMVDNSPSMKEEQDALRRHFRTFLDELKKIPGGLPNVHIGVVSSDLGAGSMPLGNGGCARPGGDRGIFQTKPTCNVAGNFITSLNNGTMNNFQGDINTVFSCLADLGVAGCGYEHQLQATRVALYESITKENAGFLRSDAFLAIVLLTDEDDCSAETTSNLFTDDASFPGTTASFRCAQVGHLCDGKQPPIAAFDAPLENCAARDDGRLIKVREIVDSIRALKKRPDQQILVSGLIGWPNNITGARYRYINTMQGVDVAPICQSSNGDAAAGLRLKSFIESFGASGNLFSICQDDYSPALKQIGEHLADRLGTPCLSAPVVDTVPEQPGLQADCQVIDRLPAAGGFKTEEVPPCSGGQRSASGACWQLEGNARCDKSGLKIVVDRGGQLPPPGGQQVVRCLTCASPVDPRCPHPA